MEVSPLAIIDRLSSRSTFRGFTGSPCGIIGTLIFLTVTIWMNVWIAISYSQGNYFQSSFETQTSAFQNFQVTYDLKMAIVFINKTSGLVANHSALKTFFDAKMFSSNSLGNNVNTQEAALCNSSSNYFEDSVNPVTLKDCFIFTPNRAFLYTYSPTGAVPMSQVGFYFSFTCLNSLYCRSGGSTLTAVQNNLIATFTNFSMIFIFSTRVLQPDGSSRHQVYNISSGEFTNPSTISASFDAEIIINNITMDYSIMPWTNMVYRSNLAFYGLQRATPKTSNTIFSPLPKIDTIASNYQNQIFRYYKKEDWLLGVIGGSAWLIYLSLWILCHPLNQGLFRKNAAEQLLLQVVPAQTEQSPTLQILKKPSVSYSYLLLRFLPCYRNKTINALTGLMDITNIIKMRKMAERNVVNIVGAQNLYNQYRYIQFELDLPAKSNEPSEQQMKKSGQVLQSPPGQKALVNQSNEQIISSDMKGFIEELSMENFTKLVPNQSLPMLQNKTSSQFQPFNQKIHLYDKHGSFKNNATNAENKQKNEDKLYQMNEEKNENFEFQAVKLQFHKQQLQKKDQKKEIIQDQNLIEIKVDQILSIERQRKEMNFCKIQKREQQQQLKIADQAQIIPPSDVPIRDNQENIQPERNHKPNTSSQAQLLGLHPEAIWAIKNSSNYEHLLGNFSTAMHAANNIQRYRLLNQTQQYDSEDMPQKVPPKSKKRIFFQNFLYYLKLFDFYSVKIQFNADSANYSGVGLFFTFVIIALPCLQLANLLQQAGTYQVYVSKDFLQPSMIDYTLTTGDSFRPAVCTSFNAYNNLQGSGQTVQMLFYTYTAAEGYTYYNPIKMDANTGSKLGITPDSMYYNLDTSRCFIMPDNLKIPMGGYNTNREAFFGFRITGFCSGTNLQCSTASATVNAKLLSFLSSSSNSFTLYTQINQYNPQANSIYTGQVYPHVLKEGTTGFNANMTIEESLYLDRIQLIDSYSVRFVGGSRILQQTIETSRYQLGEVTKEFNTTNPYYELRLRPSGNVTKIFLVGSTLDVILGMIGGIFFLVYIVFHNCGKFYNGFNVRSRLAQQLYNQQDDSCWNAHSLFYVFARPLFKLFNLIGLCPGFTKKLARMQNVDKRIKSDLNAIEMIKTVTTCFKLSTIPYQTLEQKELASIYFKEKANTVITENRVQVKQDDLMDGEEDDLQQSEKESGNRVANQEDLSRVDSKNKFGEALSKLKNNKDISQQKYIDRIPETQPFRDQAYTQRAKMTESLAMYDIFHSDAEFSLNGQWRVRSIFGFLLSLLTIIIILCVFTYYIINFDLGFDRRISYNKGMLVNPSNTPPMQFSTNNNFRIAFGFYTKPSFAFKDVSSFNINTPNSTIGASVYQVVQVWTNNIMTSTETKYDLIPCPANYFDGFMNPNDDPSYYSSVVNGFCLPYNLTLKLTAQIQNNSHFFRVSVYNKTAGGSSLLQSLTNGYVFGLYMSVPMVNLEKNGFSYQVQQIRPNSEVLTRAYGVNLTLTKQSITFTDPNYTAGQNSTTVTTYNYLENRAYEINNTNSATSLPRVYTISFTYSGLEETYKVTYSSIAELFGYLGGISLVVLLSLGCIGQSFNTYYKEYLIGKELYLLWPEQDKKSKKDGKAKQKDEKAPLIGKGNVDQLQSINDFNQFDVFRAWLLSFLAGMIKSYDWNENLSKIHMIRSKVLIDLDLFKFYPKLAQIRDTINSDPNFRLSGNRKIPLTSIHDKKIIRDTYHYDYDQNRPFFSSVIAHQLSSRAQWILFKAEEREVRLERVFDLKYLEEVLAFKPSQQQLREYRQLRGRREEMRREVASSRTRKPAQADVEVDVEVQMPQEYGPLPPDSSEIRQEEPSIFAAITPLNQEADFQYNIQDEQQSSDSNE